MTKILDYSRDYKEQSTVKLNSSKFEYDLYDEDSYKVERIIRVKRYSLPNNGEKWKISVNGKVLVTLEGIKMLENERSFLRGVAGVNFLIKEFKNCEPPADEIMLKIKDCLTK